MILDTTKYKHKRKYKYEPPIGKNGNIQKRCRFALKSPEIETLKTTNKTLLCLNSEHLVSIHPVAGSAKGNGSVPSKA